MTLGLKQSGRVRLIYGLFDGIGHSWLQDACLLPWPILDLVCLSDLIIEAHGKSQEKPITHNEKVLYTLDLSKLKTQGHPASFFYFFIGVPIYRVDDYLAKSFNLEESLLRVEWLVTRKDWTRQGLDSSVGYIFDHEPDKDG